MFLRAVELSPDEGHSKYMYLGQMHTGKEAIHHFSKGIEIMLKDLEKQAPAVSPPSPHRGWTADWQRTGSARARVWYDYPSGCGI